MNGLDINMLALVLSLMFSKGGIPEGMSKEEYKSAKYKISEQYKVTRAACQSLSGKANDICEIDANGKQQVALAELDSHYNPSPKSHYEVQVVKAEAGYALAKEHCDDKASNAQDACLKKAKSIEIATKGYARVQLKSSEANPLANKKFSEVGRDDKVGKIDAQ